VVQFDDRGRVCLNGQYLNYHCCRVSSTRLCLFGRHDSAHIFCSVLSQRHGVDRVRKCWTSSLPEQLDAEITRYEEKLGPDHYEEPKEVLFQSGHVWGSKYAKVSSDSEKLVHLSASSHQDRMKNTVILNGLDKLS